MTLRSEISSYKNAIIRWLDRVSIGKTVRKRELIAQEIFWPANDHGLTAEVFDGIADVFETTPFVIQEGDIFENLGSFLEKSTIDLDAAKLVPFFKEISDLTPIGLDTSPTARCGKWELFCRLVWPGSSQPKKGDILHKGKSHELKGSCVRLQHGSLSGFDYITSTNKIFEGHELEGNDTGCKRLKGSKVFEIEKKQHRAHYSKQFCGKETVVRDCLAKYMRSHGFDKGESNEKMTEKDLESFVERVVGMDGEYNLEILQRKQLEVLFSDYKQKQGFDVLIIFGDGSNVKIVEDLHDLKKLTIENDYFRIGQDEKIGWYVS